MFELGRRDFITLLGGAVATWPLAARAQHGDRVRHIGVLLAFDENDPAPRSAFVQALAGLGWIAGRNVRMDLRSAGADANRIRALAQELVGLQPDIILAGGSPAIVALQRETPTIPIVFVAGDDAVASGFVPRLDRRVGTSPASAAWKPRWEASGLSYSWRSRPGSTASQSCSIPTPPLHRLLCPHLRRRPSHSRSRQSLRPFIANEKLKQPSSPLGASREVALSSCQMCSRSDIARR